MIDYDLLGELYLERASSFMELKDVELEWELGKYPIFAHFSV